MEAQNSKHDNREGPAAAGAAARGVGGGLQQLMELGDRDGGPAIAAGGGGFWDRRLQAAAFFLIWGCCMVLYGTVLNPSANPEHVLTGLVMLNVGAALALLTLGGARAGRAASRLEEALRGFF